jgi:hypothetical protein
MVSSPQCGVPDRMPAARSFLILWGYGALLRKDGTPRRFATQAARRCPVGRTFAGRQSGSAGAGAI